MFYLSPSNDVLMEGDEDRNELRSLPTSTRPTLLFYQPDSTKKFHPIRRLVQFLQTSIASCIRNSAGDLARHASRYWAPDRVPPPLPIADASRSTPDSPAATAHSNHAQWQRIRPLRRSIIFFIILAFPTEPFPFVRRMNAVSRFTSSSFRSRSL